MASNWWLFIGVFLVCSGIGTPVGIILLIFYFWDHIRSSLKFSQYNDNTYNINNLNVHSDGVDHSDENDTVTPIDHLTEDAREELR